MPATHPGYHCLQLYASHTSHRSLKPAVRSPKETMMCRNEHSEDSNPPHIKRENTDTIRNRLQTLAIPSYLAEDVTAEDSDTSDHGEESELVIKWGKDMAKICEVNHRGLYLLLMSFYHQIDHNRRLLKLSDDCTVSDVQELQPFLRGLPKCGALTSKAMVSYLEQNHPEPVFRLVKWMQMTFGHSYFPPPEFLKVSGFSDNIWQFTVLYPPARIRDRFNAAVIRNNGQTSVRWHGTAINTLHSILQNGFLTDRIWTAGKPAVSWRYAFKQGARDALAAVRHPLYDYGILLGLEVADQPVSRIVTYPLADSDKLIVRYVFVLPPNTLKPQAAASRHIALSMEAAFREWPSEVKHWDMRS
ncbi:hypothetical protein BCIN_02g04790 [Botrytis cinerea B05.10]|uniref:Uncharacterized protein n=2 Tax=Botryotinia fuckeliana TaxID=40559 RepID=A0A384J9D8_BOTFB|nr:hypothetical protein BCIN_02g04790 [Botrytis cinerea B05.10]XP_024547102.1 hypothetical protein BCIN_02g04790 [Botrytis cinerea B05.10]ATZ47168.1 hypothetical protein BCIN_02g04790 [Botrytis cinerea B05.10]ATZ47169.1 hypothetical protein BCIN_02g04790 [Botrytis cinerea B05.10]